MAPPQGSAKTKQDAERAYEDTTLLDKQVDDMIDQLSGAEAELAKKKAEADSDMMMASMVQRPFPTHPGKAAATENGTTLTLPPLSRRRPIAPRRPRTTPARPRAPSRWS